MRVNEPVTDHEAEVPEGEPLVSRTDPAGRIAFANHVFVELSGFTEQELIGAPHNIVRHPHMPVQAFANLWETIKAGRPWDGLVKNRSKSGGFYWVRANVTPVVEDGKVSGYISIRCKPTRAQIATAEHAYTAIRNGTAKGIALSDGEVVRSGARAWIGALWHSVVGRLLAVTMAAVLANEFTEADTDLYLNALIEIGLVLFAITLIVNSLSRILIWSMARPARQISAPQEAGIRAPRRS